MTERNTPALETERLVLRRFYEGDVPELLAIFSDEDVCRFVPCRLNSMEQAERYYREKYEQLYRKPKGCGYAVCLKGTGELVGYVGAGMEPPYDLGYGYKKEHWRKGYASEAARAVVDWLRDTGLPYVTATHDVENPRSGKVMRAIGMTYRYTYHELWQTSGQWVWFRMYQLDLNGEHEDYMGYWEKYPEHMKEEMGDMI